MKAAVGKALAVGAAVAMAATACGGSSGATGSSSKGGGGDTGTLTVWIMNGTNSNQDQYFAQVDKAFEAAHPGVHVNVQFVPWTAAHQKFVTAVAGGAGPDVAEMGTTWTPEFAATGGLSDVTAKVNGWSLKGQQVPGLMDSVTYQGKQYGVPWYAGVRSLIYRSDWFQAAGLQPPQTWDDLVADAQKMQQAHPGVFGFEVPGANQYALYPFIWEAGGSIAKKVNGSWKATIDEPAAQRGIAFYTGLLTQHHFSPKAAVSWNAKDQVSNFELGKAAMSISGEWEVTTIEKDKPELKGKIGVVKIPVEKAGDPSYSFAGGSDLVAFKGSKHQQLAWEYMTFLDTPKWQQLWAQQTGFFPSNTALLSSGYQNDPIMSVFADQLKTGKNLPSAPKWGAVQGANVIESMTQAIMTGKQTVEEATKAAAQQIESELNG